MTAKMDSLLQLRRVWGVTPKRVDTSFIRSNLSGIINQVFGKAYLNYELFIRFWLTVRTIFDLLKLIDKGSILYREKYIVEN